MRFANVAEIVSFVASKKSLPDWQKELYSQYRDEIRLHARGELFYKVDRLFPNEHPLSKEHRILSFESITKGSYWKGVNNIIRIFENSSYSFTAGEKTVEFISEDRFNNKNLFSYLLELWCNKALADDANGKIVVYPFEFMVDKIFPQVLFVPTENIEYIDNETIVFISEEESEKRYEVQPTTYLETILDQSINAPNIVERTKKNTYAKKLVTVWTKKVYHVFTDEGFYRIEQVENIDEFNYEFYKHKNTFFPVVTVGGVDAGKGVNQSFFSVFCPFGNLALLQHSQHTAVNFMFSFPRMDEIETPCTAFGCEGKGWVSVDIDERYPDGRKMCNVCLGSGFTTNQTPYKVYKRKFDPDKFDDKTAQAFNVDSVKFYTPDSSILDYSKSEWKDYLDFAEQALYVRQRVQTGNVESAKSKEIDVDEKYDFVSPIRKAFFHVLRFVIQMEENYLNASPDQVTIDVPGGIGIESEFEALESLQTILTSAAPVFIKASKVETFVNKFVSQSSPVKRFFEILQKVDFLLFYTDAQIASQKMGGVVSATQWATHIYSFPVLSKMFKEDKGLFDLEDEAIITKLTAELKTYMPDEEMLKQKLINDFNSQ